MVLEERFTRVAIEAVTPEVDAGRFAAKRIVGDTVTVEADIFGDGHDALAGVLRYRPAGELDWREEALTPLVNDRWRAAFTVDRLGAWDYMIQAWVDPFATWRRDLEKRVDAGQDITVELLIGAELLERLAEKAAPEPGGELRQRAAGLQRAAEMRDAAPGTEDGDAGGVARAFDPELAGLAAANADRTLATETRRLTVTVDPPLARFGAWYEMFPRSAAPPPAGGEAGRPGTLRDVEARLPYVAAMGFDVLYLPPIHPIGLTHRKGPNNSVTANPGDPGSPWAIGAAAGGHTAIHPELGPLADFDRLVARARELKIEVALDIAFQASPDHPFVRAHPEWFRRRPDGTIQYAENPPKKYEDIIPFDFESADWRNLWAELKGVFDFWLGHGVRVFRVDNPHTKPFAFWEWALGEVKREHPEALFLSEAFTRPKVMYRLAKLGFSQSYTYFAWRNTKQELIQYFSELASSGVREYFRPNLWPNTPDILTEYLQVGGRPAFIIRLALAATLGASYGFYGPPYEQLLHEPLRWGSEEYRDSEKYEVRHWDVSIPGSLAELVGFINRLRREHPALQRDDTLRFHATDNDQLICYSKQDDETGDALIMVVNLDPYHTQAGWVTLDLAPFELDPGQPYQVHDLLSEARYLWHGARNYVELNPHLLPVSIFRPRRRLRSERDFEYFM